MVLVRGNALMNAMPAMPEGYVDGGSLFEGPLVMRGSAGVFEVPMVGAEMAGGMAGHERAAGGKDEWLTPRELVEGLGPFDLDPCAPVRRPWDTARRHYTVEDDGLRMPWEGLVWLNPPYGTVARRWMRRMAEHGEGVALLFARTETEMFFESVWPVARVVKFLRGRVAFCHLDGRRAGMTAGAPSCLIGYGEEGARRVAGSEVPGRVVWL